MKNSFKYIFIFTSILFLNNIINASSSSRLFKEDCDQQQGLKIITKMCSSFETLENSFIDEGKEGETTLFPLWIYQSSVLSVLKNRLIIAFNSVNSICEMEKAWDPKDK